MTTTSYLALLMATSAKFVQPQLSNANEPGIDSESSCIVVSRSLINLQVGTHFFYFFVDRTRRMVGVENETKLFF